MNRTRGLLLRRQSLYPTELRSHDAKFSSQWLPVCQVCAASLSARFGARSRHRCRLPDDDQRASLTFLYMGRGMPQACQDAGGRDKDGAGAGACAKSACARPVSMPQEEAGELRTCVPAALRQTPNAAGQSVCGCLKKPGHELKVMHEGELADGTRHRTGPLPAGFQQGSDAHSLQLHALVPGS